MIDYIVKNIFLVLSFIILSPWIYKIIFEKYVDNIFNTKLEEMKCELEKSNIKYLKLHEDRAEIIKKLYSYITMIESQLEDYNYYLDKLKLFLISNNVADFMQNHDLVMIYDLHNGEGKQLVHKKIEETINNDKLKIKSISDKLDNEIFINFQMYMYENKIFFSKELWANLQIIEELFYDIKSTNDFVYYEINNKYEFLDNEILNDEDYNSEYEEDRINSKKILEDTKLSLENQFRELLGVDIIK